MNDARTFMVLDGLFAICKLAHDAPLPAWARAGDFFSITRSADELSIVCRQEMAPDHVLCECGWRCMRVAGTIPFTAIGVLASLTAALAQIKIGVFLISTYDTDYLFVKEADLTAALVALQKAE